MAGHPVNWPDETWHEDYFPRGADEDAYRPGAWLPVQLAGQLRPSDPERVPSR